MRLGMTQESLGELAGLDSRFIRRIEAAQVHMVLETLLRLAAALDVKPGTLLRQTTRVARRPGRPNARRGGVGCG